MVQMFFCIEFDEPFILRTDASEFALGAVLEQQWEGKWVPVAFYSRKLAKEQKNWTLQEKETYAIVAALRKWEGWIGFQQAVVKNRSSLARTLGHEKRRQTLGSHW
jgi:hypothetical protein